MKEGIRPSSTLLFYILFLTLIRYLKYTKCLIIAGVYFHIWRGCISCSTDEWLVASIIMRTMDREKETGLAHRMVSLSVCVRMTDLTTRLKRQYFTGGISEYRSIRTKLDDWSTEWCARRQTGAKTLHLKCNDDIGRKLQYWLRSRVCGILAIGLSHRALLLKYLWTECGRI